MYGCSGLTFKIQTYKVRCGTNRKLMYHSQHEKNQLHACTHLKIQQIWEPHEQNGHAHFWLRPPKNYRKNFQLSWICTSIEKISSFHLFLLEIQSISEPCDQAGRTHFRPHPPKMLLINFKFMQKIRLFYWFVLDIWFIKKSCNLIRWEHFGPYLRNKNFPKYWICAKPQDII